MHSMNYALSIGMKATGGEPSTFGRYGYLAYADPGLMSEDGPPGAPEPTITDHAHQAAEDSNDNP